MKNYINNSLKEKKKTSAENLLKNDLKERSENIKDKWMECAVEAVLLLTKNLRKTCLSYG